MDPARSQGQESLPASSRQGHHRSEAGSLSLQRAGLRQSLWRGRLALTWGLVKDEL